MSMSSIIFVFASIWVAEEAEEKLLRPGLLNNNSNNYTVQCPTLNIPLTILWWHVVLSFFLSFSTTHFTRSMDERLKWMGHVTIFFPKNKNTKKKIEKKNRKIFTNTIYEGIHAHTFTQSKFLLSRFFPFFFSFFPICFFFLFCCSIIFLLFFLVWHCWRPAFAVSRAPHAFILFLM